MDYSIKELEVIMDALYDFRVRDIHSKEEKEIAFNIGRDFYAEWVKKMNEQQK